MTKEKNAKLRILILGYGGTIVMKPDANHVLKPIKSAEEIATIIPNLGSYADITFRMLENRDSTNIFPFHWTKLIGKIVKEVDNYDGIIITHGTDTMAYTASAVAIALGRGLPIPVVFTGSQLPLIGFGTDARFNLENAVKTIGEAVKNSINEVMIVFADYILRACRSVKTSEARFPAFDSPVIPRLGELTAVGATFGPLAQTYQGDPLVVQPDFQRDILTIDLVPGLEPELVLQIIKSGKCKGMLLKSLGAGNVPSEDEFSLIPIIKKAVNEYDIPVLISTKFVGGYTRMEMYEPGALAMEAGGISTKDMTDVMAQVKFMWALAQGYKNSALAQVINQNYIGEISS